MVRLVDEETVTPAPVTVRLLNEFVPLPLTLADVPLIVTVLVLPVNVPLFDQFPPTECENEPALNVVEDPIVTFPKAIIYLAWNLLQREKPNH